MWIVILPILRVVSFGAILLLPCRVPTLLGEDVKLSRWKSSAFAGFCTLFPSVPMATVSFLRTPVKYCHEAHNLFDYGVAVGTHLLGWVRCIAPGYMICPMRGEKVG